MLTFRVASRVNQYGEWVVMAFENSERASQYDAFETDKDAAIGTCKAMMRHEFGIIAEGYRDHGEGSGTSWTVMRADEEHVKWWVENHYDEGYYGGPGQPYSRRPSVVHRNGRVIITQSHGMDI